MNTKLKHMLSLCRKNYPLLFRILTVIEGVTFYAHHEGEKYKAITYSIPKRRFSVCAHPVHFAPQLDHSFRACKKILLLLMRYCTCIWGLQILGAH